MKNYKISDLYASYRVVEYLQEFCDNGDEWAEPLLAEAKKIESLKPWEESWIKNDGTIFGELTHPDSDDCCWYYFLSHDEIILRRFDLKEGFCSGYESLLPVVERYITAMRDLRFIAMQLKFAEENDVEAEAHKHNDLLNSMLEVKF